MKTLEQQKTTHKQEHSITPTLYLIRGIPGAGKSTFANVLLLNGVVEYVFEADDYFVDGDTYKFKAEDLGRAHELCQFNTRRMLNSGHSVAVSNTSVSEWEVGIYETIAIECNAKFVSIVVEGRHSGTSIHNVPDEKVEQMKKKFSVKL
jgi:adenylylsulfate kinase-like enzyme